MPLILWQIRMVGDPTYSPNREIVQRDALLEKLLRFYPVNHKVCVYEAALYCVSEPRCDWCDLKDLSSCEINGISTMFIPILRPATYDQYFLNKLNLRIDQTAGV